MSDCIPSAEEALRYARHHRLIPVYRDLLLHDLTPVRAYSLLCPPGSRGFLLESVEGGERLARYSFIGYRPEPFEIDLAAPLDALREIVETGLAPVPGLARFQGGVVGYLGYEIARRFESLPAAEGESPPLPAAAFLRAENLVIFDHATHRVRLYTVHRPDREEYPQATSRLEEMEGCLRGSPCPEARPEPGEASWESNLSRGAYCSMVEAAREEILAGEAFQVVLSQRFSKPLRARPLDVYRCLRSLNPSPYMFNLALGDGGHLVGTSPEVLIRVEEGRITSRPLAGTRRRGATPEEDRTLETELLADPKERAEHVMLVDLGRNDVGRVASAGTVRVERLFEVERYSHVMHISSTVTGQLADGRSGLDAIRSAFPAGTVSGAPKLRAMEIIAELEPDRRGPYGGALGYIGFGGNVDLAITLRTIVIAAGIAHVQAGAGVVAGSVPEREYEETLVKAAAMFKAIEMAEALP